MSINLKNPTPGEFINQDFLGTVEDNNDPNLAGRARIRVHGVFGQEIPTADLPWAVPGQKNPIFGEGGKGGALSTPKNGALVRVKFDQGDIMNPMYYQIQDLDSTLLTELSKTPFNTNYESFHGLAFDGDNDLKVWFNPANGFTIWYGGSRINVATDNSITIEHKNTQSIIELRGGTIRVTSDSTINMTAGSQIQASSQQVWVDGQYTRLGHSPVNGPAVLGDKLFALLTVMATAIDAKMPVTPGFVANFVETYKAIALSNTVIVGS